MNLCSFAQIVRRVPINMRETKCSRFLPYSTYYSKEFGRFNRFDMPPFQNNSLSLDTVILYFIRFSYILQDLRCNEVEVNLSCHIPQPLINWRVSRTIYSFSPVLYVIRCCLDGLRLLVVAYNVLLQLVDICPVLETDSCVSVFRVHSRRSPTNSALFPLQRPAYGVLCYLKK